MSTAEQKLNLINGIWRHYIWESKVCKAEINFDEDAKTNYIGSLLGYFSDTFEIIGSTRKSEALSETFSYSISFLQGIYLQQDFVIELHKFFKTEIGTKQLLEDPDCKTNREIRNEFIGHPISRKRGGELQCMTLFSYRVPIDKIQYLRYHRDNGFKFEPKTWKVADLLQRHMSFLDRYLDVIVKKLEEITGRYSWQLASLEREIRGMEFEAMLGRVEAVYESIFGSDHGYDKASLLQIHKKKGQHARYDNFIERFNNDLACALRDMQTSILKCFQRQTPPETDELSRKLPKVQTIYPGTAKAKRAARRQPITFHSEIGKLATNRASREFDMYSSFLSSKCRDNKIVLAELAHMRQNLTNDAEYYSALRYISRELNS